jgi:hypothetical protein
MALYGVVRVDGVAYRFMGGGEWLGRAAEQVSCRVAATRTDYVFRAGPITLAVGFTTPLLADDLDLLSRPVTYLTLRATPLDHRAHEVVAYVDTTGEMAVNLPHERVVWATHRFGEIDAVAFRSDAQNVLAASGDHRRIDWGTAFLAGKAGHVQTCIGDIDACRDSFVRTGEPCDARLKPAPRKVDYNSDAVASLTLPLPPHRDETMLIAYDDEWSIEYFGQHLRPWWRRNGADAAWLLQTAMTERDTVLGRAAAFDDALAQRARDAAGEAYADLLGLAWRHTIAAHKLAAGPDGAPLFFSKENFSNGCIGTVDVTYPSAPLFLVYNPALLRAMIDPYFVYCASPAWPFPFAAHDLGTYPKANGQTYRDFDKNPNQPIIETQMPVEECGNMLILVGALAAYENDSSYARSHWKLLSQWAEYLAETGRDPGPQLCTDDFSGVLGHNVNLSAKAIMGLGCYAMLATRIGEHATATRFRGIAEEFARALLENARDGASTRLAYNEPDSWSLKYNLVWDRLLGLGLFPEAELRRELADYHTRMEPYGIPLDNRSTLTKPEWMLWAASLAEDPALFAACVEAIVRYANETPNRVPLSDLYFTDTGRKIGFQARSVLGGLFVRLLSPASPA